MTPYDTRPCALGEGPLWHPLNQTLYWFDIIGKKMFAQTEEGPVEWAFDEYVSAAGWVDAASLLVATETGLRRFDLDTGDSTLICPLEADNPVTRSNDGRADPWGGFWIGTMGKNAEADAGAIYRYYKGELRELVPNISISNAICFAPDRSFAYYADTPTRKIMRVPLDPDNGWPTGPGTVLIDLTSQELNPDGAVTDKAGNIWIAFWGSAKVSSYAPDGTHLRALAVPALQVTCPAFGGAQQQDLYVTSATTGLVAEQSIEHPQNGMTFRIPGAGQGVPEPQVIL